MSRSASAASAAAPGPGLLEVAQGGASIQEGVIYAASIGEEGRKVVANLPGSVDVSAGFFGAGGTAGSGAVPGRCPQPWHR